MARCLQSTSVTNASYLLKRMLMPIIVINVGFAGNHVLNKMCLALFTSYQNDNVSLNLNISLLIL